MRFVNHGNKLLLTNFRAKSQSQINSHQDVQIFIVFILHTGKNTTNVFY